MKEKTTDPHPLSDLAYDWITLIQNKAQALNAYDQYIQDAEQANSPECAAFFRKVHDADKAQLAEAKQHLVAVLQGKMETAEADPVLSLPARSVELACAHDVGTDVGMARAAAVRRANVNLPGLARAELHVGAAPQRALCAVERARRP